MRKFAKTHEWYEDLGGGKTKIGISKHAAHELSDVVFIELPDVGKKLADKQKRLLRFAHGIGKGRGRAPILPLERLRGGSEREIERPTLRKPDS